MDSVDESAILKPSVFRLHFLHYLFAKRTNLSRTCDGHVFVALVSEREIFSVIEPSILIRIKSLLSNNSLVFTILANKDFDIT